MIPVDHQTEDPKQFFIGCINFVSISEQSDQPVAKVDRPQAMMFFELGFGNCLNVTRKVALLIRIQRQSNALHPIVSSKVSERHHEIKLDNRYSTAEVL